MPSSRTSTTSFPFSIVLVVTIRFPSINFVCVEVFRTPASHPGAAEVKEIVVESPLNYWLIYWLIHSLTNSLDLWALSNEVDRFINGFVKDGAVLLRGIFVLLPLLFLSKKSSKWWFVGNFANSANGWRSLPKNSATMYEFESRNCLTTVIKKSYRITCSAKQVDKSYL